MLIWQRITCTDWCNYNIIWNRHVLYWTEVFFAVVGSVLGALILFFIGKYGPKRCARYIHLLIIINQNIFLNQTKIVVFLSGLDPKRFSISSDLIYDWRKNQYRERLMFRYWSVQIFDRFRSLFLFAMNLTPKQLVFYPRHSH